jgi:hypothetical protein
VGESAPRSAWQGYLDGLDDWNVLRAGLRNEGVYSSIQLAGSDHGSASAERAVLEQAAAVLQRWLGRSAIHVSSHDVFEVVVAMAPGRPHRVAFVATPLPAGCVRVPEVQLVKRVLQELLGVDDADQTAAEAIYSVDLLERAGDERFRLLGPAVESAEGRRNVLEAFLRALMARSPDDFRPELGHRLQLTYLSDNRVGVAFPGRTAALDRNLVEGLPELREVALADLRRRLTAAG